MTEAQIRAKVVVTAKKYLGCKMSDGSHKKIIDMYNNHKPLARGYLVKYTDSWCATFGSAIAIELDFTDIIPTECSCNKQIDLWKELGRWEEDDAYVPEKGDYIYYDWDDDGKGDCKGPSEHVGIVTSVVKGVIEVTEGNKSKAVGIRKLKVNGKYIRGYGLPDYASKVTKEQPKNKKKTATDIAKEIIKGTCSDKRWKTWGTDKVRKERVEAAGYNYDEVQAKVNEILKK